MVRYQTYVIVTCFVLTVVKEYAFIRADLERTRKSANTQSWANWVERETSKR